MTVVFVTRSRPAPIGTGDQHRAFQIRHDLKSRLAPECLKVISLATWRDIRERRRGGSLRLLDWSARVVARAARVLEDPYGLGSAQGACIDYLPRSFVEEYRRHLDVFRNVRLAVVDDWRLVGLMQVNAPRGIPSIVLPHNLESLDHVAGELGELFGCRRMARSLRQEIEGLRRFDGRLFISKVESALVSGLGIKSQYYPYLPMGRLRERLFGVRRRRATNATDRDIVVVLGSLHHATALRGTVALLEELSDRQISCGLHIVVVGRGSERLTHFERHIPGLSVLGWVGQEALDRLIEQTVVALAPVFTGFGALTRVAELSCAGVPVITSHHVIHAMDPPPGILMGSSPEKLVDILLDTLASRDVPSQQDYALWEHDQLRQVCATLKPILKHNT